MKIYTVEEDSYYNFIVAVFSTREKAEKWAKKKSKTPEVYNGTPIYNKYKVSDQPLTLDDPS